MLNDYIAALISLWRTRDLVEAGTRRTRRHPAGPLLVAGRVPVRRMGVDPRGPYHLARPLPAPLPAAGPGARRLGARPRLALPLMTTTSADDQQPAEVDPYGDAPYAEHLHHRRTRVSSTAPSPGNRPAAPPNLTSPTRRVALSAINRSAPPEGSATLAPSLS